MANTGQIDQQDTPDSKARRAPAPRFIADKLFVDQLNYVREVINFLIRRQADLPQVTEFNVLATLGTVRYSRSGEPASEQDWQRLYQVSHIFLSQLTNENATSFAVWQTRGFYSLLPFAFAVGAVIALAISCLNPNIMPAHASLHFPTTAQSVSATLPSIRLGLWDHLQALLSVLLWTISLGGLGVSAFFGTSLLTQISSDNTQNIGQMERVHYR